ncbi:MAG: hypothetical protein AVDCRST_MAG68-583 [uncultured Gemmatimonadetes bacterium]|uniref:Uncharacterized protein n=1 Tax=uncultured Gemmatimonadota bacterium TaxID=203437 RepID=A0A6J4KEH1_9BACT|nr:MAG: hypothetical protein AVDCRST_MAG68-583 [uncultured Gemmatimonadota bacterium]
MTDRTRILALALGAATLATAAPAAAQCRDPWINQAIRQVTGEQGRERAPSGRHESGECNIHLYGASWSSYGELKGYVASVFRILKREDVTLNADGSLHLQDDYQNIHASAAQVRVVSPRGRTDGAGNAASDDGSRWRGAIGLGNGVVLRFADD